jgi:phosphoribosylformimino-5-aminoimidazole carboxamide ribotide isomerase
MTRFRPCIDLHEGKVKQIVGGSLRDDRAGLRENFVSTESPAAFAARYREDALAGGHVIKLGPGNDEAARAALAAYPGGLHLGGGITAENAAEWLRAGASHVIVTSWLFSTEGRFLPERLAELVAACST